MCFSFSPKQAIATFGFLLILLLSSLAFAVDTDGDGVVDSLDNCTLVANPPPDGETAQRDTDNDGFGNRCDPDLNNDGLVTVTDFLILRGVLNTADQDADLNGDDLVTVTDFLILRSYLNQPPGPSGVDPGPPADSATYAVTFTTDWESDLFSTNFPAGRHFSGLIGVTHNEQAIFWEPGQLAGSGIENMAETGSKQPLQTEMEEAIGNGSAEFLLSGGGISSSNDQVDLEFSISQDYPLVTLVSMVAPSPDWFVGVRDLSLFLNGGWVESVSVDLVVYDAGTDTGSTFTAANADTVPQGIIALLSSQIGDTDFLDGVHRDNGSYIGTFTFSRLP